MSALTKWMDKTWYPGYEDNWDNKRFRTLLLDRIEPDFILLDYGAGRGALSEMNFKGKAKKIFGVDPDKAVLDNPYLDDARILPMASGVIPHEANSFDLVFANNVLEHIQQLAVCFEEIRRVLKPGGLFISKTPNKWHYVPVLARITPHAFHTFVNRLRGRERRDTFPTVYKCNTPKAVKKYASNAGLRLLEIQLWEGRPEYLRMLAPLYVCGYLYERWVNALPFLSRFRCGMVFVLQKP
jgi:SAM-dependent methyltransferase